MQAAAANAPGKGPGPWALEHDVVARALQSDPERGLTRTEASDRLVTAGPNELIERARRPAWRLLVDQFTSAMILVLLAAATVTAVIGDTNDTVVILAIVVLNGILGFTQEYRAEEAVRALKQMTSPTSRVVRDGISQRVPARDLVLGDLVQLEAGDLVTADLRLTEARALRINEAALTGESEPAEKTAVSLPHVPRASLADQRNMGFTGTAVTYGRGAGLVTATGMGTALGRVADLLQESAPGPTPLQRRLSHLGNRLALGALVVCVLVFALGVARGEPVEVMFVTAISLAVAAIPEGLPAVVTIALALGARRMAHRHAIVRKLPAVETLGSVSVVCSDKTGTLTTNQMLVERIWTPVSAYAVAGDGDGDGSSGTLNPEPANDPYLDRLAWVAAACNDAALTPATAGSTGSAPNVAGDPTEVALLVFAAKLGAESGDIRAAQPRLDELTFDSERRRMATFHRDGPIIRVAVKGAFEAIAPLLDGSEAEVRRVAEGAAEQLAADGYRVLALAERTLETLPGQLTDAERDLHLVGLVAMADPPRSESAPAIAACRQAGVTPVMITGDHPLTAEAIARRVGILQSGNRTLTGAELELLDEAALDGIVGDVRVYARTNPEHKLRIVDAWSRRGAVVAMTGDGVNDAPALRKADIGVAMGITGTAVSREAADMVLADDNFATIVAAIEEGRRIYDNVRRFVRYLLTTNSAELWVMVLAPFAGLPVPLVAVQLLWINLVTDGLPALALGVEPVERDAMRRPPRPPSESIFGGGLWQQAVWVGLLMAAVTLGVQATAIAQGWHWQTIVFSTLALLQLGNALAIRSETQSFFSLGWRTNTALALAVVATLLIQLLIVYSPALQTIFKTQSLSLLELALVGALSTAAFVAVEVEKWVRRGRERGRRAAQTAA